jgi:hypothetical protein
MPTTIVGFDTTQLPHWRYKLTRNFLLQSDITRAQAVRKHLESFIGRAGTFSVLRRQSSNVDTFVQSSVRDTSPSVSSPVTTTSATSDVPQDTPSAEFEVTPVVFSTGRVVRRPVYYKDTRR